MSVPSRTRNYACMVYLDSGKPNFKEIISDAKIPCFISPLHDRDLNPTGEPKKPHYHVLVMFDSVKTEKQAREFFESFGGLGCEVVSSCRAYARYLCHLDNPEKAHYNISDVCQFGGSDYKTQISTMADKDRAIDEMIDFVVNNNIIAFFQLALYARDNREDWNDALKNGCSYYIKEFIKSKYWYDHL